MKSVWILAGLLFVAAGQTAGQTYEDLMDRLAEADIRDLADVLQQLIDRPININAVPADSIQLLWFLTSQQKEQLAEWVQQRSPNITYADLMNILALPPEVVQVMFIARREASPKRRLWARWQRRSLPDGIQQSMRMRYQWGAYTFGTITEKDAGEPRWLDFLSGYVQWQHPRRGLKILFGDFSLQNGSGLAFAGTFGNPALSLPQYAGRFAPSALTPYQSVLENRALRGMALHWQNRRLSFIGFFSTISRDADLDSAGQVLFRPLDGYHRTPREMAARRNLQERTTGGILQLSPTRSWRFGLSGYVQQFNRPIRNPEPIRRRFAFTGLRKRLIGGFFHWQPEGGTAVLFAEFARTQEGSGAVLGFRHALAKHRLVLLLWQAQAGFENDYGALPGERTGNTDNQSGIYLGLTHSSRMGRWTAYVQRNRTPWRTYFLPMPVQQSEAAVLWERTVARGVHLQGRLRFRLRESASTDRVLPQQVRGTVLTPSKSSSIRIRIRLRLSPKWVYRFGVDGRILDQPARNRRRGYAQYHEINIPLQPLNLRIKWTDYWSDDYDSRVYQFDAFFANWVQPVPLYLEGRRWMVSWRWRLGKRASFAGYWLNDKREGFTGKQEFGVQFQWHP